MGTPHVHAELIKAWADGAEIEYWTEKGWSDTDLPCFLPNVKYRIKPKKPTPKEYYHNVINKFPGEVDDLNTCVRIAMRQLCQAAIRGELDLS